ncbi:hypothetical protein [Alkalihalobacillus sp. TS-13]|nr:hypothetical protein [Alkalihalobacillus sp. TS-13]
MIWGKLGFNKAKFSRITLSNLKQKMYEEEFDSALVDELVTVF